MVMFKRPEGLRYQKFFKVLNTGFVFDWYLEVGCRSGSIFGQVRGKTLAVDPFFRIGTDVVGAKPQLHIFQQTSDDFFASGFMAAMGLQLSVSFLDGMHLFEFLLRDFIGAERASRPDGVVMLHDCCPSTHRMTTRDLADLPTDAWTGDVWKLIPILRQWRPDLVVTVLDARPTGLVLISGLDPQSRVLSDNYDRILAEYRDVDLEGFGVARFNDCFDYTDTQGFIDAGLPLFAPLALSPGAQRVPTKVTP